MKKKTFLSDHSIPGWIMQIDISHHCVWKTNTSWHWCQPSALGSQQDSGVRVELWGEGCSIVRHLAFHPWPRGFVVSLGITSPLDQLQGSHSFYVCLRNIRALWQFVLFLGSGQCWSNCYTWITDTTKRPWLKWSTTKSSGSQEGCLAPCSGNLCGTGAKSRTVCHTAISLFTTCMLLVPRGHWKPTAMLSVQALNNLLS